MKYFQLSVILFFCLVTSSQVWSKHIIGGDMQYTCMGNGVYRVTLKIYRDCRPQQQAASLDGTANDREGGAFIAIYRGRGVNLQIVDRLTVPLMEQQFVSAPDYPCLIPPDNLCVEEGTYQFDFQIDDWPSDNPYHIVYQRCCRNNTITNIVDPGDVGATYEITITPESQAVCNNSPVFKEFPPTVVCVDADISFDHSAIDEEGDSLVYSFCHPLIGGGLAGGPDDVNGNPYACNGVRPSPACPPPFDRVTFKSPYTYDAPMAGSPLVSLDAVTGLISGSPMVIGQFVMAVCVQEYRDGVLLSEIKRDFQFNVADCDPTVFAQVKSDARVGEKSFVINSCGNNTVLFENESQLEQFISTYRWDFMINGSLQQFSTRDAEVTFPGVGEYRGVMMVNPGLDCGDTADVFVNLYPSINADFSFDYDTCTAGFTTFTDLSETGGDRLTDWKWSFGEGGTSEMANPRYKYPIPGDHQVTLTVRDNNECVDSITYPIAYFPVPEIIVVEPTSFVGCSPGTVTFQNLSSPIDSTYTIDWDFGDGGSSGKVSPTHVFETPGRFSVSVDITSPIGCNISQSFDSWIEIKPSPTSEFIFTPEEPSSFRPTVEFFNQSFNYVGQEWIFGTEGRSLEVDPVHTFSDTGRYEVGLVAIHENGCRDTSIQIIDILPLVTYHMPNAFTPNGDGQNDIFKGKGFTDGIRDFQLTIWDRWGGLLFETDNPEEAWTGARNNTGEILPNGVYVYQVKYVDPRGEPVAYRGFATLIK